MNKLFHQIANALKNNILPIIFTVLMAVLFLCTSPRLSSAGDINISEFLASPGKIKAGYFWISATLAGILRFFNRIVVANWWSIFSFAMMLLGTYMILWFTNRKMRSCNYTLNIMAHLMLFILVWECFVKHDVNYTHTSAMAAVTAVLLLYDLVDDKDTFDRIKGCTIVRIIAIIVFFVLSVAIRKDLLPVIFAFPLIALTYRFVVPFESEMIFDSLISSFKNRKRILMALILVIASCILSLLLYRIEYTIDPGIETWQTADDCRAYIADYPERYPDYDISPEIYDSLEIKPSWINMALSFITSDTDHFSIEELERMISIRTPSPYKMSNFTDSLKGHGMLWAVIIGITILIIVICGLKRSVLPFLTIAFTLICFAAYCVAIGRMEWRVTASCILLGMLSFVAMAFDGNIQKKPNMDIYSRICIIALVAGLAVVTVEGIIEDKGSFSLPRGNKISDPVQAEVLEYINSNKDKVYVYIDEVRFYSAYNMWASHSGDYLDNYIPLTATFIRGCTDRLSSYGISNVYADMLVRSDIRAMYNSTMTYIIYPYLCDYYDPCIGISRLEASGGYDFIRYSLPRIPTDSKHIEITAAAKSTPKPDDKTRFACDVCCILPENDKTEYTDYVINMNDTYTGNTYSYGMDHDNNTVYGTIWCMKDSWSPSVTTATLNGIDPEGNVIELGDITSAFEEVLGAPEE